MENASHWIKHLQLQPHPEGGYYKEVFRSQQQVTNPAGGAIKHACTSIYYLLMGVDYSAFHCIASDELWYFHKGSPLHIHIIDEHGLYDKFELSDAPSGHFSIAVKAGLWFAAEIPSGNGYTLVSCAVAPGFEFSQFKLANKKNIIALYPQHEGILARLSRPLTP